MPGPPDHSCIFMGSIRRRVLICIPIQHRPPLHCPFSFLCYNHFCMLWFNGTYLSEIEWAHSWLTLRMWTLSNLWNWIRNQFAKELFKITFLNDSRETFNLFVTLYLPTCSCVYKRRSKQDSVKQAKRYIIVLWCVLLSCLKLRLKRKRRSLSYFYCFKINQIKCLWVTF